MKRRRIRRFLVSFFSPSKNRFAKLFPFLKLETFSKHSEFERIGFKILSQKQTKIGASVVKPHSDYRS